jgi:hypothetical protein
MEAKAIQMLSLLTGRLFNTVLLKTDEGLQNLYHDICIYIYIYSLLWIGRKCVSICTLYRQIIL